MLNVEITLDNSDGDRVQVNETSYMALLRDLTLDEAAIDMVVARAVACVKAAAAARA